MCLVVVLHSLESDPHVGQRNTLHIQETAIISQIASFHMQTCRRLSSQINVTSAWVQVNKLCSHQQQREQGAILRGSKVPQETGRRRDLGSVESPRVLTQHSRTRPHLHKAVSATGCEALPTWAGPVLCRQSTPLYLCTHLKREVTPWDTFWTPSQKPLVGQYDPLLLVGLWVGLQPNKNDWAQACVSKWVHCVN